MIVRLEEEILSIRRKVTPEQERGTHWEYRASTGSNLDARQAGRKPARAPTIVARPTAPSKSSGLKTGMIWMEDNPVPEAVEAPLRLLVEDLLVKAWKKSPITKESTVPALAPIAPPINPVIADSAKKMDSML